MQHCIGPPGKRCLAGAAAGHLAVSAMAMDAPTKGLLASWPQVMRGGAVCGLSSADLCPCPASGIGNSLPDHDRYDLASRGCWLRGSMLPWSIDEEHSIRCSEMLAASAVPNVSASAVWVDECSRQSEESSEGHWGHSIA